MRADCELRPAGTVDAAQSPPSCRRCTRPAAGVVAVAELDAGRAADFVSEVALCSEHLGDVAEAMGYERPSDIRGEA